MAIVKKALQDTTGNTVYPITTADVVLMGESLPSVFSQIQIIQNDIQNIEIGQNQEVINARGGYTELNLRLNAFDITIGARGYLEQNYISNSESITNSFNKLDIALKDIADIASINTINTNANAQSITNLQNTDITLSGRIGSLSYSEENYITNNESLTSSVNKLDMALANLGTTLTISNGTYNTTITQGTTGLNLNSSLYGGDYRLPRMYVQTSETPPASMQNGDILLVYTE